MSSSTHLSFLITGSFVLQLLVLLSNKSKEIDIASLPGNSAIYMVGLRPCPLQISLLLWPSASYTKKRLLMS